MSDSLTGKLLVATPVLQDENFARAVVLLLAHGESGAFGVILNRPLANAPVDRQVPAWAEHVAAPGVVFAGGPVEAGMALGIASAALGDSPEGWTDVAGGLGLVDLTRGPEDLDVVLKRARVFTGYAGWGAGQVEAEIAQDAWFVVDAHPSDPFTDDPGTLWRRVLARQRGHLKLYALYPEDARLN